MARRYVKRRNTKKRITRRKTFKSRINNAISYKASQASNTIVLNKMKANKVMSFSKSNLVANNAVGSGGSISQTIFFDPSGTYSTIDGTAPSSAVADWTSLTGLFDHYKVKSIKLTFTIVPPAGTAYNTQHISVYGRYNYDTSGVMSATTAPQLPNVKVHYFTQETPQVTFIIYPRTERLVYNTSGVIGNLGTNIHKMGWTDVDYPSRILGFMYYMPNLPTNWNLQIDCTYNMLFKYNK